MCDVSVKTKDNKKHRAAINSELIHLEDKQENAYVEFGDAERASNSSQHDHYEPEYQHYKRYDDVQ